MDTKKPIAQDPIEQDLNIIEKAKANRKRIIAITIFVVVAIIGCIIWYLIADAGARKADNAIALADTEMNDSIALNYYMDAAQLGYKSGNRAGLEAAIALYNKGDYEQALTYLKKSSVKSSIVEAGRYSLMGDCYANLGKLDDAVSAFKKGVSAADNNPQLTPFILVKLANVYRAQQNYKDEYQVYQEIFDKYPSYTRNLRFDIRKYAERAKAASQK